MISLNYFRCSAFTSGSTVLRLELQAKAKCDNKNDKDSFHRGIASTLGAGYRFENTNYTCCSTSCCYPNSLENTEQEGQTKTSSGTTKDTKTNDETQSNAKSSDTKGKKLLKYQFLSADK